MRYLSLFSGVGGFDLGFDRAGMTCAGQVEIDDYCRRVLAKHWPDVPRINDVREVNGDEFGTVDLICGGFPCQDVSVAGRRAGLAGERSGLWHEFHRIVDRARPRWVVVENVPGLLSSHGGRDFATVIRGLVECGYGVAWRVLDAQYFGVPQRRRRVFIVGSLGSGRAAEVLFEREGGAGHPAEGREARAELARDVAPSLRYGGGNGRGFNPDAESGLTVMPYVMAHGQANAEIVRDGEPSLTLNHEAPILAATLNSGGNNGGFRTEPGEHLIAAGYGVRRLTPVECERLQGFPTQEKHVTIEVCLDHQKSRASAEILNHKSPKHVGNAERSEWFDRAKYAARNSSSSSPHNSEPAQNSVLIFCEERTAEIHSLGRCCLSASFAESKNLFPPFTESEDFAHLVVGLNTIAEQTTPIGKAASQASATGSVVPLSGNLYRALFGSETMPLANDAGNGSIINKGLLKSIISSPSDMQITEPILTTLYFYVLSAISGYIPRETLSGSSFKIEISSNFGWTYPQSDSARYRQMGNAVAVPVAEWIGRRIMESIG